MTDDKIVDLNRARRATVTHEVPSDDPLRPKPGTPLVDALENLRSDNLRGQAPESETLARLGLDADVWPGGRSTRVALRTLKELRDRAESAAISAAVAEQSHIRAAALHHLAKIEMETLGKRLTEIIGGGDEPEDFDPRGGAA